MNEIDKLIAATEAMILTQGEEATVQLGTLLKILNKVKNK